MQDLIVGWLLSHKDIFIGFAAGYALGHIPQIVGLVFDWLMKIPPIKAAVLANPERLKKLIDDVEQALDKEIDEEVKLNAPPPPPAPK